LSRPASRWESLGPWVALLALAAWSRIPGPWTAAAAALAAAAAVWSFLRLSPPRRVAVLLIAAGAVAAFVVLQRESRLTRAWDDYWFDREGQVVEDLGRRLDQLLDRSITSVETLADAAAGGNLVAAERVRILRREAGLAALALYGSDGRARVWDGMHRGRVPEVVKAGVRPFLFGESPLFAYLYVAVPVEDGGTAVGAILLRADLPGQVGDVDDFASSFRARTGEQLRLSTPARARAAGVFDYMHEGQALFSLTVERPAQADRRRRLVQEGQRAGVYLILAAWLLLVWAGRASDSWVPWGAGVALALLLPVDVLPGMGALSSPGDVLFPWIPGGTLARVAVVFLALIAAAGAAVHRGGPGRIPPWIAGAGAALVLAGLTAWFGDAASVGFLAGEESGWVGYQATMAAAASLVIWGALWWGRGAGGRRAPALLAVVAALGLGAISGWLAAGSPGVPGWMPLLWCVPITLAAGAVGRVDGSGDGRVVLWGFAVLLAGTLTVPISWGQRLEARIDTAASEMDRLGTGVDPYLRFLLERLADAVDTLDAGGAPPAEMLYRGWRASGLAETGYPLWMTVWTSDDQLWDEELRIGMGGADRPVVANQFLESARASDTVEVRRFDSFEAHYMAQVPISGGRVVTAVVPPLGTTGAESLLGPLFGSLGPTRGPPPRLVPLFEAEATRADPTPSWTRREGGWLGERPLRMAGADYWAHVDVPVSSLPVLAARGALLLALNLGLLSLAWWWGAQRAADRESRGGVLPAVTSFRARVTLALFAFFALSNLIFGSLAYRTIAGASQRASRVLAERAAQDAANSYYDLGRDVDLLASRVGVDVVEYKDGELREASVEELVSLGLYEGWVPYPVYRSLISRESLAETTTTALGQWEYVTAYRRLPDGDVMGAPVPLQAGATALQSRDVVELLAAAVLGGAALSFLLALLVGRALTQPIQTLRVASERVGSGNLGIRLAGDRHDEFGAVFQAFNRMVRRLRRARRDLVRTSRRTQAIVEDAATGVLAFDAEGVVTLVNPAARALLDLPVEVGSPLPEAEDPAGEFVRWMRTYFRDAIGEASLELQSGDRRVRVRARRISQEGPLAGAVVSLEDVTDELRTERILAWGEMARQVAHEVKNPLTPIKLSVQHLRRAWEDRRPDFGDILTRNAEAMLGEIDRLAGIATSFSRFGAPRAVGEEPLAPVDLGRVVAEVLTLYDQGGGAVRFSAAIGPEVPAVMARTSELKEVLVNLLENSRAAVRAGGEVRVEARRTPGGVVLAVVDDGAGIPEALQSRVFEPHFSTRSSGTGLGLAIVHRLVTSWDATIDLVSGEGTGTKVSITFPEPQRTAVSSAHESASSRGGPRAGDSTSLQ
jgi:signal transduction histidine kinase